MGGINHELGFQLSLEAETITKMWTFIGPYINETNILPLLQRWIAYVPEGAPRIKLILSQTRTDGLTAITVIIRAITAITTYPTFAWIALSDLYAGEWTAVKAGAVLINANPYAGYGRDLGALAHRNFVHYAYVCKELLVQVSLETDLNKCLSFKRPPSERNLLDEAVNDFKVRFEGTGTGTATAQIRQAGTPLTVLQLGEIPGALININGTTEAAQVDQN